MPDGMVRLFLQVDSVLPDVPSDNITPDNGGVWTNGAPLMIKQNFGSSDPPSCQDSSLINSYTIKYKTGVQYWPQFYDILAGCSNPN